MNPYYEPFTLDGEARKPIVEYEGFRPLVKHDGLVLYLNRHNGIWWFQPDQPINYSERVPWRDEARALARCKVLERCGELLDVIPIDEIEQAEFMDDLGNAALDGDDAAINALAHRIAKEAGL